VIHAGDAQDNSGGIGGDVVIEGGYGVQGFQQAQITVKGHDDTIDSISNAVGAAIIMQAGEGGSDPGALGGRLYLAPGRHTDFTGTVVFPHALVTTRLQAGKMLQDDDFGKSQDLELVGGDGFGTTHMNASGGDVVIAGGAGLGNGTNGIVIVTSAATFTGGISTVNCAITNNGLVWFALKTNGVPNIAAPPGSICTTTNGQLFVIGTNSVWVLK